MAKKKAVKKVCTKSSKVCKKTCSKSKTDTTETKCPLQPVAKVSFCQKLYSFFFPVRS